MQTTLFDTSFAPPASAAGVTPQTLCPSDRPLVLFPVRLETRFFTLAGNVTELRVRVYPDRIHVDTHQPELTTAERTSGVEYWQRDWGAADDTGRADAWAALADRFGAARAAWIARVLLPTNAAQRGTAGAQPTFPTLPPVGPNGESAWRRAPIARLLPDRWVAIAQSAGQAPVTVTGPAITPGLAMGPDPTAAAPDAATQAAIAAGDVSALDPGMQWMVDFAKAEQCGMALRLTIPPAMAASGVDTLVVFGVAATLGAADSAAQLADLLDAHHYTDGLEFLRFGTPTNNTDDRRAAYSTEDPQHARSFAAEVRADPTAAPNGTRLGSALGIPAARVAPTLGRLPQAGADHDGDMRSMNTALWQVGWGYFLTNMMGGESGVGPTDVDWARGYFRNWVRAGGPLPALRVGTQPYGVLPVTSLDLWAPGQGETVAPQEPWLKTLLVNMRERVWRPVLPKVARVGLRTPPDPDSDLADVMRTDGVAHGYGARTVLGRHYLQHLLTLDAEDFTALAQTQDAVALKIIQLLALPTVGARLPHAAYAFFSSTAWPVTAPLVQKGEVSPWQPLAPDYIGDLLAKRTVDDVVAARIASGDASPSLLRALLRHAMLREYASAAAHIAATVPGRDLQRMLRDLELVDLVDPPITNFKIGEPLTTPHWRRQLAFPAPGQAAGVTIAKYLEGLTTFTAPEVVGLGEFRDALAHLRTLDSEALQFLMQGTLDLSAHRLDAWITAFATKRLGLMTANGSIGQRVGAYGWVENLRPAAPLTPIAAASLPAGEAGPLFPLAGDSGFIHAPSLTHAGAAALLRNAHLAAAGAATAGDPLAIDLSSRRVRAAARLLDGVREGQPLGALLGYHLERRLHDLALDRFVKGLRAAAPLAVGERVTGGAPVETLAASNVVDGLVLLGRWEDPTDTAVADALRNATPAATPAESTLVAHEMQALRDAVDGLSDALTAESAYQLVRGNPTRVASTLSAVAHGEAPPPELEVARTPRSGTALTHRVLMLMSGAPAASPGWLQSASSILANNERALNAWASRLLGDAREARCTVEQLDAAGAVVQTIAFPLAELPLAQLDFVYAVEPAGTGSASLTTVEQWVLYHAQRRTPGVAPGARLRLQHARPTNLAAGETTLFDMLEQARTIRRLLERARGVRPADLAPPDRTSQATMDLVELDARVVRLENALNAAHKALDALVAKAAASTADELRAKLLAFVPFAITPAVPNVAAGDTPDIRATLLAQAASLLKTSAARLAKGTTLRAQPAAADPQARCDQILARASAAMGDGFVMLPAVTLDAAAATELGAALAASTAQQGGDALAAHGWFARVARVRDAVARFGACMRTAEVLGAPERLALSVAQLPFDATERWVGLPPLAGVPVPHSKLSVVVQSTAAIAAAQPLAGLYVDEWVEVVPSREETTAIAFQFDPPNAFAPQSVLVAVPPVVGQPWTTESLRRVLTETLDLAKIRAVDTSLLGAAAQYLPGLYVPFNAADHAVSTDFSPLTA